MTVTAPPMPRAHRGDRDRGERRRPPQRPDTVREIAPEIGGPQERARVAVIERSLQQLDTSARFTGHRSGAQRFSTGGSSGRVSVERGRGTGHRLRMRNATAGGVAGGGAPP